MGKWSVFALFCGVLVLAFFQQCNFNIDEPQNSATNTPTLSLQTALPVSANTVHIAQKETIFPNTPAPLLKEAAQPVMTIQSTEHAPAASQQQPDTENKADSDPKGAESKPHERPAIVPKMSVSSGVNVYHPNFLRTHSSSFSLNDKPVTASAPRDVASLESVPQTFVSIGDWGMNNSIKYGLIAGITKVVDVIQPSFYISLGDNFYQRGVRNVHDPKFHWYFEQPFAAAPFQDRRWYVILGNHDRRGSSQAQVAYTKLSNRWYMPQEYYTEKVQFEDFTLQLWCLDGGLLKRSAGWFAKSLAASTADWKIVLNHGPLYSAALRPLDGGARKFIEPLLSKYGVHLYLAGHMHVLEVVVDPRHPWTAITAGSGADLYQVKKKKQRPRMSVWVANVPGCLVHYVNKTHLQTDVVDWNSTTLYSVQVQQQLQPDGSHRKLVDHHVEVDFEALKEQIHF
eukprot:TRINITY_DN59913_c0_g2_i1.p1 TRINITY_DN59913_c0_g2~~TRINITY_DN59913_c0_g2_i1.p1  ORF type:complete len:455 (-),score=49.04 TRINITY_DN59913_c0_g2_i1:22-1386(-)